ncbi:CoA ester lyase [uncultured Oscillibacter sp.]|uniref:HpcH/HpaI aldolase/citrate lyase family protein n=1 Tax=uncultured Oscillibacter sp. TaxID=876091 RepID=UPI0025E82838|nr:CoA ester lyase [uncultured Oscillibacter sp.]
MKLLAAKAFLFTPGDQEKKILQSLQRSDCAVVLDLEDSVLPEKKPEARALICRLLKEPHAAEVVAIRINSPEKGMLAEDMRAVEESMPAAIFLPKGDRSNAEAMVKPLKDLFERTGRLLPVIPIIETARGFEEMAEVFRILPYTPFASFGGEDLATDMRIRRDPGGGQFEYARSRFILSCVAYHVIPSDTVFVDYKDAAGLEREVAHVRDMGMMAKSCIHPAQIELINRGFAPPEEAIREAQMIVEAAMLPENQGRGSVSVHGRMVDIPVIQRARELLARAGL